MSPAKAATSAALEPSPSTYVIMGREVRVPVEVRDATAAIAYYLVPSEAAQRLISPSALVAARVLPSRTLCTIGTMDYKDSDLGQYHEIAVTFFVHERRARPLPFIGTALRLLRGGIDAYIQWLPVDGEFTCEAGRTIWGFPKFVTEIALSTDSETQTSVLRAGGQEVLRQTVRTGGARGFSERPQVSYAYRDGVLYKTLAVMSAEGLGARLGGARLELGAHPLADELRALGLPGRPVFTTYVRRMTGRFYAAERFQISQP